MTGHRKWPPALVWTGAILGVLLVAVIALVSLVPSDEELAQRAEAALERALGVKVTVGSAGWRLFPTAVVTLRDVATVQPKPVTIKTLTAYPELLPLLGKRLKFSRAEVDSVFAPQLSLNGLRGGVLGGEPSFSLDAIPLGKLAVRQLTWVSRQDVPLMVDGDIEFDANWRPRQAQIRLPDAKVLTELNLQRQGQEDVWAALSKVGGGSVDGEFRLESTANDRLRLSGKLSPRGVEVSSMLEAFNRRPILAGKASGQTTVVSDGANLGDLVRSMHSKTVFNMGQTTLLRFDMDKAIRSMGKDHQGQTRLESLTGQLDTQNTNNGMVLTFTGLKAKSGALSATGSAKLQNRTIDAEMSVDLVDGLVGVPLKITGPLSKVAVSVPPGAIAGAAVGTAILPGIGTAIGARIGNAIGNIFGSSPDDGGKPKPVQTPKTPPIQGR